jgi:hypothetical protein
MRGTIRAGSTVTVVNDVGGTTVLPKTEAYRVEVSSSRFDRETGRIVYGRLIDADQVAIARKAGTTGFSPDDYKKYANTNPNLYTEAVAARANFDPARVTFPVADFTPDTN